MVDEDIVIGYVLGYNDGYDAGYADGKNDGGGLSQKDIDDLIQWVIDQITPQLPDGTPEITPPTIDADNDFAPSIDGADHPYLVSASADGGWHEVMYGVLVDTEYGTSKYYYVDLYADGTLIRHEHMCEVGSYGHKPGSTSRLLSDGRVEVTSYNSDGTSETSIWGSYLSYDAAVWAM